MCYSVLCFSKVELDDNLLWLNQLTEVIRTWHM